MVTTISSSLSGGGNFTIIRNDVSSNSHSFSLSKNVCRQRQHQPEKIQNYFPFRCATYQRVNNFFDTSSLFIKKQTNILAPNPGRFYLQQKTDMKNQTNIQEYCRYRDAQHHSSTKVNEKLK
jgi:hypothetical protein